MARRPRSVPPSTNRLTRSSTASPSDGILAVHRTRTTIPSTDVANTSQSPSTVPHGRDNPPSLLAQADALAKMTLEMNLRTVSRQAERLERELRGLVRKTADDAAFRAQHESRLQDMWKEILAVKAHMAQGRDTKDLADEACRRETRRLVEEMRGEMEGVRRLVGDLSAALSEMPSAEQMHAALSQSSDGDGRQDRGRSPPSTPIRKRIAEAVKSTRRWHRDHKTTTLADAAFCAQYLQQQSKRDAGMAVFLQRAIQRRVQARYPGRRLRPQSLDEFCQLVQWADVKGVVEDVLMRDTSDVEEALSK